MDSNQKYLTQLHQSIDTEIEELRVYAEENQVGNPKVDYESGNSREKK